MKTTLSAYTVAVPGGTIEVQELGVGHPLLFLHGAFTDGSTWAEVAGQLAPLGYRCILPTLPLGAHQTPFAPDADFTPPGMARLLAELIKTLDLAPATVVSNDTATAFMQLLLTSRPELVRAAVLSSGDAYDHFLPPVFASLKALPYLPGSLRLLARVMRHPTLGRQRWAFGRLSRRGMTPEQAQVWSRGLLEQAGIRRDVRRLIQGFHRRHTLAAAKRFGAVQVPVLVVWGAQDEVFARHLGERMARDLGNAKLHLLENSSTYVQRDAVPALAALIHDFVQAQTLPAAPPVAQVAAVP